MPDKKTIQQGKSVHAHLTVNELRNATIVHTSVHSGSEQTCAFCRTGIVCLESGFKVEAQWGGTRRIIHFHARCHDLWAVMREGGAGQGS